MQILTLKIAKELKGKKILYRAPAYWANYPSRGVIVIGELISEWDYHKTDSSCPGFESRTAYWESYMKPEQIEELKNTIILLDKNGEWGPHYIRCHLLDSPFDEPTFTTSAVDREVSFEVIEDENANEKFEKLRKILLDNVIKTNTSFNQYLKIYDTISISQLMTIIKNNFLWFVKHDIIDGNLIDAYKEEFAKDQIWHNQDAENGYMLVTDNAKVKASRRVKVFASGNAKIRAKGHAEVTASGNVQVYATNCVYVEASDFVTVKASRYAVVTAYNDVHVVAADFTKIIAYDNAKVIAFNDAKVRAYDNVKVDAYDNVSIEASKDVYINSSSCGECKRIEK